MHWLRPDPGASETAVLVPVPTAEPVVGTHRTRLDPAARWGVPAHVTVLYPFVPPTELTDVHLKLLAATVGAVSAFTCTFSRTAWFGQEVLWLAPDPDGPFRALTTAVSTAFPDYPPYGGAYADVIPHLTVGEQDADGADALRAAEAEVRPRLPFGTSVDSVLVLAGAPVDGAWQTLCALPLGPTA
ncbi:MAG TPA: 2'-5' RNA ligase family protein [Candidatus Limnocylindria bacterium]|nr:2'-5' RNA ligase family protein [Candidatus Limnocylindria bacterium]